LLYRSEAASGCAPPPSKTPIALIIRAATPFATAFTPP